MTQLDVFGSETAAQPLPTRQDVVMRLVIAHAPSGVSDDEAGAAIHAGRGKHNDDTRCQWCGDEGRQVLYALQRKKLVTRRRGSGMWTLPGDKARREHERAREAASPGAVAAARSCSGHAELDEHGLPVGF